MKRILSIIISIILISQMCYAIPSEVDDVPLPNISATANNTDKIAGTPYQQVYPLLKYLGIITESSTVINTEKELKRGEASEIIARISSVNGFTVERASKLITTQEAVGMIFEVMGYGPAVEYMGIDRLANDLGVYKGYTHSETVTLGNLMILIENALTADLLRMHKVRGEGYYSFTIDTKANYLSEKKGVYSLRSILTSVEHSSMYYDGEVMQGKVALNRKPYAILYPVDVTFVGKTVEAYVDSKSSEDTLICLKEYKTDTLYIDDCDFISASQNEITYSVETSVKRASVLSNAKVIYNRVYYGEYGKAYSDNLFTSDNKTILIDNDLDGIFDVIHINRYSHRVLNSVSSVSEIITFKFNQPSIDYSDNNVVFTAEFDGERILPENFKEWDIFSILEATSSKGKTYYHAIVSRNIENGILEEITNDEYVVNKTEYPLTNEYLNFLATDTTITKPSLGNTSFFYISFDGKIVVSKAESGYIYAYLMGAGQDLGLSGDIKIKVYGFDSIVNTYDLMDKVTLFSKTYIDGKKMSAQEAYMNLKTNDTYNTDLIAYKINADNKVTTIVMEYNAARMVPGSIDYPLVRNEKIVGGEYKEEKYRLYAGIIGTKYLITSTTKIMTASTDQTKRLDEKTYSVKSKDAWGGEYYFTNQNLVFFNVDSLYKSGILLVESGKDVSSVEETKPAYVVKDIVMALDEDDIEVKKLILQRGDEEISIYVDKDTKMVTEKNDQSFINAPTSASDIQKGDIIQYYASGSGKAGVIRCIFRTTNPGTYRAQEAGKAAGKNTPFESLGVVYGKVVNADSSALILNISDSGNDSNFLTPAFMNDYYGSVVVTLIEANEMNVFKAERTEMQPGDTVVVKKQYNTVCDVFIIR